jgi:hypothetical protein
VDAALPVITDPAAWDQAMADIAAAYGKARAEHHGDFERAHYAICGGTPSWETPDTYGGCGDTGPVQEAAATLTAALSLAAGPQASSSQDAPAFGELDPADEARIAAVWGEDPEPPDFPPDEIDRDHLSHGPRQDDEALDQAPPLSIGSWGTRDDEGEAAE